MDPDKKKGFIAIIFVNVLWGFDFIAIEYMMDYVSPQFFTLIRLVIGSVIMLGIFAVKERKFSVEKRDIPKFLAVGAIGVALYFNIETWGTELTSASFATLVMAMVPVFGIFVDWIIYKKKLTAIKMICVAISVSGVVLLVVGAPLGASIKGFFVMLLAALLWTIYVTSIKPLEEKYSLTTMLTCIIISGLIVQIPIVLIMGTGAHTITPVGIMIMVATAIVCLIIGEYAYVFSVGKLSISMVTMFENVLPVITALLALIIFKTHLGSVQLIGGALVIIATTMLALKERKDDVKGETNEVKELDKK